MTPLPSLFTATLGVLKSLMLAAPGEGHTPGLTEVEIQQRELMRQKVASMLFSQESGRLIVLHA